MTEMGHDMRERAETTIQAVILVPVVLLVVFMCFQVGAYFHHSHMAEFIASRGAEIASSHGVSADTRDSAVREMKRIAADLGSQLAHDPTISYEPRGVRVRVVLGVPAATPLLPTSTTAEVRHSYEAFIREQDRT